MNQIFICGRKAAKCDEDLCAATNLRLWRLMCFIPCSECWRSDRQGDFRKEKMAEKEKAGDSSALVLEVLKAQYKRCTVSFWYSDSPAYTQHYDTFGWSHCRINGPALSFSTTMPRFRDAISHMALHINAGPKIYINLCLKMKAERGLRQWS